MQNFLRKLICRELNVESVNTVLRGIRSLDWEDKEVCLTRATKPPVLCKFVGLFISISIRQVVDDLKEVFTNAWEVGFNTIGLLASILAGLMPHHREFVIDIVDAVIEDIRVGMEVRMHL